MVGFSEENCAPLLTDLFLHAYEADFLQGLRKNKDRKLVQIFNSSLPLYRWCSVTEQFSIRWLSASHLSKWDGS